MSNRGVPQAPLIRWATPSARVLCCALLVVATATAPAGNRAAALLSLLIAAGVLALARPAWSTLWRRALVGLFMVAALVLPLALSGRTPQAGALGVRASVVIVIALGFASTFALHELGASLRSLRVPASLATVVHTMLRQLSVVRDEGRRISLARSLRAARGTALSSETLSALLLRTIDRAERVELAMALRGGGPEALQERTRLRTTDLPALLLTAVAAVAVHAVPQLT